MAVSSEDAKRVTSILESILESLDVDSSSHNLQHFLNVQAMVDCLKSPLFNSLLEIQNSYKQSLESSPGHEVCRESVAVSLSEEPELLPLYRQRYGITDPISSESQVPSSKSGSKPKATPPPGSLSAKKKKKKRVHRSVSEGGSDLSIISDSGRFFPLIEERTSGNLRTSTIADLVHWSPGTRGHEMSDLQGDTVRRVMLSSTESSLSSVSSETPSHNKTLPISTPTKQQEQPYYRTTTSNSEDKTSKEESRKHELVDMDAQFNGVANFEANDLNKSNIKTEISLSQLERTTEDEPLIISNHNTIDNLPGNLEEEFIEERAMPNLDNGDGMEGENLSGKALCETLKCTRDSSNNGHNVASVYGKKEDGYSSLGNNVDSHDASEEYGRVTEEDDEIKELVEGDFFENKAAGSMEEEEEELNVAENTEIRNEEFLKDEIYVNKYELERNGNNSEDDPWNEMKIFQDQLSGDENGEENRVNNIERNDLEEPVREIFRSSIEALQIGEMSQDVGEEESECLLADTSGKNNTVEHSTISTGYNIKHHLNRKREFEKPIFLKDLEESGIEEKDFGSSLRKKDALCIAVSSDGNISEEEVREVIRSGRSNEDIEDCPRDILFFMRDKRSQAELTKVLNRREPRTITLSLTEGNVGGASKAGLKLGGFSTTGVFVDSIIPGSEAEMKDLVQKGDQLLQINDTKIESMASFEVDLLLREAPVGEEMTFSFLYNPTGYIEYQRIGPRRGR